MLLVALDRRGARVQRVRVGGARGELAPAGSGVGMAMRTATCIMLGVALRWCSSAIACPDLALAGEGVR